MSRGTPHRPVYSRGQRLACRERERVPLGRFTHPREVALDFTYRARPDGVVEILHRGRPAAILRGAKACEFLREAAGCDAEQAQQLMARRTGNFKRGNERLARSHPRNRTA